MKAIICHHQRCVFICVVALFRLIALKSTTTTEKLNHITYSLPLNVTLNDPLNDPLNVPLPESNLNAQPILHHNKHQPDLLITSFNTPLSPIPLDTSPTKSLSHLTTTISPIKMNSPKQLRTRIDTDRQMIYILLYF